MALRGEKVTKQAPLAFIDVYQQMLAHCILSSVMMFSMHHQTSWTGAAWPLGEERWRKQHFSRAIAGRLHPSIFSFFETRGVQRELLDMFVI
jgi:hypothetical protein